MDVWTYRILGKSGTIITQDPLYAELKSRMGYPVFCKREIKHLRFQF